MSVPIISIVVPVYNTEKYLDQCLESLSAQTEKNIEIIVVDDGSTDSSALICDNWTQKDNRIRVIHQKNGGVVTACRTGFDTATGLYFTKVDSDDWVKNDFCETLGKLAADNNLDMIISGYFSERQSQDIITKFKKNIVDTGYNLVAKHGQVHTSADICYSVRMAFRTEFLREHNLFFGQGMKIGEDTVLNVTALEKAQRVMAIDYSGYHYRDNNNNSVMRKAYKESLENDLHKQFLVRSNCFADIPSYSYDLAVYYFTVWFYSVINNCKYSPDGLTYRDIKRILNSDWVVFCFKKLGFKLPCTSKKEYIMAMVAKFRLATFYYLYLKIKG